MEHPLISLLDTPTLPVAFSSRNRHRNPKGCILANDEFYVVFESYPLVVKQMAQLMSEQRFDLIPIEYLYAASVFYRKSRNPHGPSSRPIYAFCLEYTEFIIGAEASPHNKAFCEISLLRPPLPYAGGQVRTGKRSII